tara:strand:+ start:2429 stop:3043 length:615 start_codon:yes stop_codon:yes gene_type:complete
MQSSGLQAAFRLINERLFDGNLPDCMLTMQRRRNSYGYMSPAKFESRHFEGRTLDEIAINPAKMPDMSNTAILTTLTFNMCRVWQEHFGTPGRGRYINQQLADKMESIGLISSDTQKVGGARTGQHTGGYVLPGGPLDQLIDEILAGDWELEFQDRVTKNCEPSSGKKENRTTYKCSICHLTAYAKPKANLVCGNCNVTMSPPS